MKKLLPILMILCMLLSVTACDDGYDSDSSSDYNDEYISEDEEDYAEEEEEYQEEIPLQYVDSSCFSQVGYRDGTLIVVFHNSGAYQYMGISESLYYDFINADSLGGFYNDYIKGQYPSEKL